MALNSVMGPGRLFSSALVMCSVLGKYQGNNLPRAEASGSVRKGTRLGTGALYFLSSCVPPVLSHGGQRALPENRRKVVSTAQAIHPPGLQVAGSL